jgi:hypothetical protein
MRSNSKPRIFKTHVDDVVRWLENNYYRKDRDWNYKLDSVYAVFEFKTPDSEQAFHRKWTSYFR